MISPFAILGIRHFFTAAILFMGEQSVFIGFNVQLGHTTMFDNYYKSGKRIFNHHKANVKKQIDFYAGADSYLLGTNIQDDWFPAIDADIFISHSHENKKLAISLAGWLYDLLGLTAFVDSCIWGCSNDLLKVIDDKYCYNRRSGTYDYGKRNHSTSHVHMMLCMALNKMIDKTECLFFINTPESLEVSDDIEFKHTASPWIYAELQISRVIRQQRPNRFLMKRNIKRPLVENSKKLRVKYNVDLTHLVDLRIRDLVWWRKSVQDDLDRHALDKLYLRKNILTHNAK